MKIVRAFLISLLLVSGASAEQIQVSAAVSLKEAMTTLAKEYKAQGGDDVALTFGSSGQLETQIKNGAPVDVFISAANLQVDDLEKAGMAEAGTRRVVAANSLVLVVPAGAKNVPAKISDLADAKYKRIAIGDPKTVPAGEYAMQTLTALKLVDATKGRIVYGANVRQVLAYVEDGDVDAGLVYATDAKEAGNKVKVAATAGDKTHLPIVYPAVLVKGTKKRAAALKFLDFIKSEKGAKVLERQGFTSPAAAAAAPRP